MQSLNYTFGVFIAALFITFSLISCIKTKTNPEPDLSELTEKVLIQWIRSKNNTIHPSSCAGRLA
jgi:hypothetical protein